MTRRRFSRVASFFDGFRSGYQGTNDILRDMDLAEVARSKVGEQDTGAAMPAAADVAAASNDIRGEIDADPTVGNARQASPSMAPTKRYTFLGQTFDSAPDEAKMSKARTLAMAGVYAKYGQPERAMTLRRETLAQDAINEDRDFQRQVRPLQLSNMQRADRQGQAAEKETQDAAAVRAEQGAWFKQRLTGPDGVQRAPGVDDYIAFTQNRIGTLAAAGKPEEAARAFQDFGAQTMAKIAMETNERRQAVNTTIAALQSGDMQSVAKLYNRFIPDGANVVSIRPVGAGQVEIVREADGKPMPPQRMSLQELRVGVEAVADPQAAWQMSMQLFNQRLALNADARGAAAAGREAETFKAGAPGRAVTSQVATLQGTLLDPKATPSAREAAASALDGYATRTGKGGDKPAQVALAEAFVRSGLKPDMRSALEFAMTARDKSPEAMRSEIYKAALNANFGDAKRAQKTTEEAMQYLSAPSPGAAAPASVPPAAQREVGKTYQTPSGPMVWRGIGWEPAPGALPRIATKAEFDKLPSGAQYVGPDGVQAQKPQGTASSTPRPSIPAGAAPATPQPTPQQEIAELQRRLAVDDKIKSSAGGFLRRAIEEGAMPLAVVERQNLEQQLRSLLGRQPGTLARMPATQP